MWRTFPQPLHRRRTLIESLLSSVKCKLSARASGRSLRMQMRQALLHGLSFNLCRLKRRWLLLRTSEELDNLILNTFSLDLPSSSAFMQDFSQYVICLPVSLLE